MAPEASVPAEPLLFIEPEPAGLLPCVPTLPDVFELIEPVVSARSGQLVEFVSVVDPDVFLQPSFAAACGDFVER